MLGERTQPHEMSLLNPLSGATKQFRANIPADLLTSVAVTNSPMMVFVSTDTCIRWADQNSPVREMLMILEMASLIEGNKMLGFCIASRHSVANCMQHIRVTMEPST